jgi:hypothetical protein
LLDDVVVPDDGRDGDGDALWESFSAARSGEPVRFVCPVVEPARRAFAERHGLVLHESWWLRELEGPAGGTAGLEVTVSGATARTVAAPPVYDPPGPVLFLPGPVDDVAALRIVLGEAPRRGCPAVVVNQQAGDDRLAAALRDAGFRRHCDYLTGVVA